MMRVAAGWQSGDDDDVDGGCGMGMAAVVVLWCLSGLKGLYYILDKVVPARTTPGPNNINHNDNNPNKWRWDAENEDISRINIPRMKFNKWEELAEELMR
ncbi:hypothetical protein Tco_1343167 [Tanacetum coccineum]